MPELQPPNLLPPMAGLALLSQIAERRQQNQLAYERMVQESALRQQTLAQEAQLRREGFKLESDRLAQQQIYQKKEMENLDSEIKHRADVTKRFQDQDVEATNERSELGRRINAISEEGPAIGTNDWNDQFNEIVADYPDIMGDTATQRMLRTYRDQYKASREAGQKSVQDRLVGKGFGDFGILASPTQGRDYDSKGKPIEGGGIGPNYSFVLPNPKPTSDKDRFIERPFEKGSYGKLKNDYDQYFGTGDAPIIQQNQANAAAAGAQATVVNQARAAAIARLQADGKQVTERNIQWMLQQQ